MLIYATLTYYTLTKNFLAEKIKQHISRLGTELVTHAQLLWIQNFIAMQTSRPLHFNVKVYYKP